MDRFSENNIWFGTGITDFESLTFARDPRGEVRLCSSKPNAITFVNVLLCAFIFTPFLGLIGINAIFTNSLKMWLVFLVVACFVIICVLAICTDRATSICPNERKIKRRYRVLGRIVYWTRFFDLESVPSLDLYQAYSETGKKQSNIRDLYLITTNQNIFLARCKIEMPFEEYREELNRKVSEFLDGEIFYSQNLHVAHFLPNRYARAAQRIGQALFFAALVLAPFQFFVRELEKLDFTIKGVAVAGFLLWVASSFLLSNRRV